MEKIRIREILLISQIKNGINVTWRQELFSKPVELLNDLEPVTSVRGFTCNEDDHTVQTETPLRVKAGRVIRFTWQVQAGLSRTNQDIQSPYLEAKSDLT